MPSWGEFTEQQPEFAERVRALFEALFSMLLVWLYRHSQGPGGRFGGRGRRL